MQQKCLNCFSRHHETVFCKYRKTDLISFLPEIDMDLMQRFMQILDLEERHSLALLSPTAFNNAKLKQLTVVEQMDDFKIPKNSNFLLTGSFSFPDPQCLHPLNTIIFKCKNLNLEKAVLTSQEFLRLLSFKILNLRCINVVLTSTVTFLLILQAAPNMEVIDFDQTNISTDECWPNDIFQEKKGNRLKKLRIPIQNVDFVTVILFLALRVKSTPDVIFLLDILNDSNDVKSCEKIFDNINSKMENYFISVESVEKKANVKFTLMKNPKYFIPYLRFALKTQ